MAEIDYQLALLLQHQFEQEAKKPKEYKSDIELAKTLQEQFHAENEIMIPKNGLVYRTTKTSLNSSKCLVDPSWEVVDPTPDIHVLFMMFNDRYFFGALMAVCVSWSKRMMRCAGVCSYQGSGGLCNITLSEPLLKLRPRKDLVETLLHEMIHAYLFVTNNNKDRDGHGPEFHKHMYRINKEAGTNISVYHDFHDEVRLYQQHWWQCDGPCQKRKPYFGMVRRATNRAPGPNDRWWGEHSRNCGGNFRKVKEPDKPVKKTVRFVEGFVKQPKEDIRKYITSTNANTSSKEFPKPSTSTATSNIATNRNPLSNIHTINTSTGDNKKVSAVIPKASNIFGFTNLTENSFKEKGGVTFKNNSSTIIINKKPSNSTKAEVASPVKTRIEKNVNSLLTNKDNDDYAAVRNHWLNKFSNTTSTGVKRSGSLDTHSKSEKIPRLSESIAVDVSKKKETVDCPVCLESFPLEEFNEHLDICLHQPKTKHCIICGLQVSIGEYEIHVRKCSEENFDDVFETSESKSCTVCEKLFTETEYDKHIEKCLLKFYDDMEEAYCDKDAHVDCLTCGKSIHRSELNDHLDDCMGLSRVFEDDSTIVEVDDTESCDSDVEKKFNCPFCMELVSEIEMRSHIDSCLNTESNSRQSELNKTVLISSMRDNKVL